MASPSGGHPGVGRGADHLPAGEDGARVAELRSYRILDTPPERAFDDVVEAAAAFCDTPIALVSLVDTDRQWFKACMGLDVAETPIDQSVCAIAIHLDQPLIIPDLALDPRTAGNPLVTEGPRIRFYAGVQLATASGYRLGTICVIDTQPRPDGLSQDQLRGLRALARQVTYLIEMRRAVEAREATFIRQLCLGDEANAAIDGDDGPRHPASGQDARSTAAQEAGRIGTFELDLRTDIASVSPEFCRIFGLPEAASHSARSIEAAIILDGAITHSDRRNRTNGTAALDVEYRIRRPSDGQIRWIARRARFEREQGRAVRMLGIVHDVTERRTEAQRVAALLELGDLLREADSIPDTISIASGILGRELGVDRAGYTTIDRVAGTFEVERDWTSEAAPSLVGVHALAGLRNTLDRLASDQIMSIPDVPAADWLGEDRETYRRFHAHALINVPLVIHQELRGVLFVHSNVPRSWNDRDIGFAHGVADRTYATIAQLDAEEQRNMLNLELSHRMKNMLAMVQAVTNQTLKPVEDRHVVNALNQRLVAIGSAHDVLLQDHGASAAVDGVVQRVLATLGVADRVQIQGPTLAVGPRTALTLSLLLHELATNALKYGALSRDGGHVELRWRVEGTGAGATFRMEWREAGGPPVSEPSRKGFGSKLIGMGLSGAGGSAVRYRPSGVEAEFAVLLDRAKVQ